MPKIAVLVPLLLLGATPPAGPSTQAISPPLAAITRALPECRGFQATATDRRAPFQKLGDLPSANAYQAVLRAGPDGCPDPMIASYGHGSPDGPSPAPRR